MAVPPAIGSSAKASTASRAMTRESMAVLCTMALALSLIDSVNAA
jgi:hypothetical protein